jgi:hypothetical protein
MNFNTFKKNKKMMHVLKLWRKAYNSATAASYIVNIHIYLHTKFAFFGRQMISSALDIKNQRRKMKQSKFVIMPGTPFKITWNFVVILLLSYTAFVTPLRSSFFSTESLNSYDFYYYMEIIIDICFIADLFVNFVSAYQRKDGSLETNNRKIALNYLTGFFLIDLVASVPINIFIGNQDFDQKASSNTTNLLKLARLQRLQKLMRIIRIVKLFNMDNYSEYISRWLVKMKIP